MRRHHVNRNFTEPLAIGPIVFSPSSFERIVKLSDFTRGIPKFA